MSNSLLPHYYTVHGILQASILEWVAFPFSRGSFETRSSTFQADFLPAEPQGKPKNTGVSSLFFLQGIFLTQESNQGLLHCRRILYLSGEPPAGKESTCNAGDLGSIHGLEDALKEGMATQSSILAWRIPWTEEPGRLQPIG